MSNIDYKELADFLLDHLCEGWGVDEVIGFLYSSGYTKEQLLALGFNEEDINTYKGDKNDN